MLLLFSCCCRCSALLPFLSSFSFHLFPFIFFSFRLISWGRINFGSSSTTVNASVKVFVGGKECINAVKLQTSGQPPHIECKTQRDQVRYKSIMLIAATQNVTYSALEWQCDQSGVCGGEYSGGKQLFMMQCEDSTYGLFGEWCVDCPHITDAVTSASDDANSDANSGTNSDVNNNDNNEEQALLTTAGCGANTIGSDLCLKPVLRNGQLDYIARCPTGSSRLELPAGSQGEAYEVNRIYDIGICSSPDALFLDENIRLACAPFPNAGFYKYYTNSSDVNDKQIATSRCHSLRQPPGGTRKACSFVVSCEPRDACFENNVCALDDDDENFIWSSSKTYTQGDFVMISGDRSQMYICLDEDGCRRGLDLIEEYGNKLKQESAAITQGSSSSGASSLTPFASSTADATTSTSTTIITKWARSNIRGLWKQRPQNVSCE